MRNPKISIITVVFNSEATIVDTIESVRAQNYPNMEYIVVDGLSKDRTLDRIHEHGDVITRLVSEKDFGIYDAMNKGIRLATGEVIGFINGDDFYMPGVLAKVAEAFLDPGLDACYGDLCYVRQNDISSVVRHWRSSPFVPGAFEEGWCPPHPTFFVRREVYERHGLFDLDYRIAADVELMMRFLERHHINSNYLPGVMVTMRLGGTTNRSWQNILQQNREVLHALKIHGLRANPVRFFSKKLVSRGIQVFRAVWFKVRG
ncbi:UNVERIFIED_ORG: glycosyltransferase involved in cell wall biosynthesis [Rhizobium etli]|uniref:Glycosyltransferase involved in cell wall biosynthesis n=1 Tax=Rhizobium lentis TaxID=1138194 RepID=A0A7W9CX38_9HYPH|nr:glycosyltransferase family 2 protein [Rhizobium lentis]MBB4575999.1 glycosyltransferase involved in cell wall biosynthesis [Rhizobium lentis]MBB5552308.1 glycosyltransferase involved in cell wall biosynthesis [Rhizobium lentis]MBB5563083.1 glycosyltransferase involved in cell wall biosynthesis [Rhizobium lentis]MBB5569125.1 glycosyltransferase involved in cell wall biosynthesis [Rhizobium lentis]